MVLCLDMEQNLNLKIMLKTTDKIAVWMESNLDDDYGKMGISALRYLDNEIVCVVDSVFAGKKLNVPATPKVPAY